MSYFDELSRTVQQAIKAGQIGQPVFVRCLASAETEVDRLAEILQIVPAIRSWVGDSIKRLYAIESSDHTQRTLLLEFRGGATSLVGTTTAGPAGPTADVIVLGNRGAIYHEGLSSARSPGQPLFRLNGATDAALEAAIVAALRSGTPQTLPEKEGKS